MPFASIRITGTQIGTKADSTGRFSLNLVKKNSTINVSSIGFQSESFQIKEDEFRVIRLKEKIDLFSDLIVKPKEDPAHVLLKKVWKNKSTNDHEKYDEIQARLYNSVELYIDSMKVKIKKDSNFVYWGRKPAFVVENLGFYFQKKGNKKELIEHSISSMPKNYPSNLFFSPNQIPTGFYESDLALNLNFAGIENSQALSNIRYYSNPADPNHFKLYDYQIEDTLISGLDSSITVLFKSQKNNSGNTLKGKLSINTRQHAIEAVTATNADSLQNTSFFIDQRYAFDGESWFPANRAFEMKFFLNTEKVKGNLQLKFRDDWSEFKRTITEPKIVFDGAIRQIKPKADTISRKEFYKLVSFQDSLLYSSRYQNIEKLESKKGWKQLIEPPLKLMQVGMQNGIPIGKFFLVLNQFATNPHELIRVGAGIQNDQINNPRWRLYGSGAWAWGDKKFKYESVIAYHMTLDRYNKIEIYSQSDLQRPGLNPALGPNNLTIFKNSLGIFGEEYVLDHTFKTGAAVYIKPFNFTQIKLFKEREIRTPLTYIFGDLNKTDYWQTGVSLRFAYKESINRLGYMETVANFNFPVVKLNFVRYYSASGPYSAFYKGNASITQMIKFNKVGKTMINLSGGESIGELPYPYLFNTLVRSGSNFFSADESGFYGVNRSESVLNRYIMLLISHDFESQIFKTKSKIFRPEFRISYNIGIGSLHQNNINLNQEYLSSGVQRFQEYGLSIRNLMVFKIRGFPIGIGVQNIYNPSAIENGGRRNYFISPLFSFKFF